jgi:hypothetical protein
MPWTKGKFLNYDILKSFCNLKLAREKKRFKSDSSVLLCLLNHVSIFESGPKPFLFATVLSFYTFTRIPTGTV